jgi:hypothetical protein
MRKNGGLPDSIHRQDLRGGIKDDDGSDRQKDIGDRGVSPNPGAVHWPDFGPDPVLPAATSGNAAHSLPKGSSRSDARQDCGPVIPKRFSFSV